VPLRLELISGAIEEMIELVAAEDRNEWLGRARQLFHDVDPEELRAKLQDRRVRVPWLVTIPVKTMDDVFAAPDCPRNFSVVAADGSSIPADRHSPAQYHVINTGHAIFTYGEHPHADLDSSAQLYFQDEDVYLDPLAGNFPIEGTRLSVKMGVAELKALWEASKEVEAPVVAVRDGSLILWALQNEDIQVQGHFLEEFLRYLESFRTVGIPIVSYISYPGARDTVNSLRVWLCQGQPIDCDNCSSPEVMDFCGALVGILDRQLFGFLGSGERSDIFESTSAILNQYGVHRIQFFYVEVGGEVVRIEAPQWVMRNSEMLDLVQALVYDQCRRSGVTPPYPPALQEAHEQTVISTTDRWLVEGLVEKALARKGIIYTKSAKDRSKRRRAV
jgi:hypothetical protein